MKKARTYLSILGILLVLFAFAFVIDRFNQAHQASEDGIRWELTTSENSRHQPVTEVELSIKGTRYALGTYEQGCIEMAAGQLGEDAISGLDCVWGGGGYQFGVFRVADGFEVKRRLVEEGSSTIPGFYGSFEHVLWVD